MRVFAIGDPHLSLARSKPMHRFGPSWWRHAEKLLKRSWQTLGDDDLLLIPGDLSWATKRRDAQPDLRFLATFPGTKICIKGNHDYWWESDKPIEAAGLLSPPQIVLSGTLGIAGTRGWDSSKPELVERERKRLRQSLRAIEGCTTKLVMLHYPPHLFIDILTEAGVHTCVYGHVHVGSLPDDEVLALDGVLLDGVMCHCVACDRIDFTPKFIGEF